MTFPIFLSDMRPSIARAVFCSSMFVNLYCADGQGRWWRGGPFFRIDGAFEIARLDFLRKSSSAGLEDVFSVAGCFRGVTVHFTLSTYLVCSGITWYRCTSISILVLRGGRIIFLIVAGAGELSLLYNSDL